MDADLLAYYLRKFRSRLSAASRKRLLPESGLDQVIDVLPSSHPESQRPHPTVLYVALKYDYGRPEQGLSFEENCFLATMAHMNLDVVRFDFKTAERRFGREVMNQMLVEAAFRFDPDLAFFVLFKDEITPSTIEVMRKDLGLQTLNWFCDDEWRFDSFSRHWAPLFDSVVTTRKSALPRYSAIQCRNVLFSQWGCNHFLFRRLNLPHRYDVSFVGQPFGMRTKLVRALRRAGLSVATWGQGWPSGRLTAFQMVRLFNQTRVNLDFLDFSRGGTGVKARTFEISGSGGFVLAQFAEELGDYYRPGDEIETFSSVDEAIDKVRFYLEQDESRSAIALRGLDRTLREHTMVQRLERVFEEAKIG